MYKVFAHKLKVTKEKYTVKFKLKSPDDDYDNKYNFIASNDSVQKIETIVTLN